MMVGLLLLDYSQYKLVDLQNCVRCGESLRVVLHKPCVFLHCLIVDCGLLSLNIFQCLVECNWLVLYHLFDLLEGGVWV